ncbi:metallophosphoesterase [Ketogulonicigenium vulgare]|uniref:Phosphatase protein n=1 Tax=Ketogulonicigenium vulgare (strain WSH-001) TaxID=759362 RepID=F9Y5N5_KETVW|nr:metallophosphoesterase [Ketogulonicigenium vulgare]ADO43691.1 twin-arginine translocation pathway signal [Ketogulonicigenium vulgare Y25]AEM41960.1 Phosphatase protein [Ketogulonicigenium vulgare WSH-001]ALJ82061.1 phosphatase [Ketogulonicigenium vulgare]ANW34688.1 phosphatase [Ketogulonicigenium vulgare]AOZ55725.1 twin-arginine translocation pathway signal [Ketogulonicigenium vulgare]
MVTRRNLLAAGPAAALLTPLMGATPAQAQAEARGPFRFGLITDPQYAPVVPNAAGVRFYANSLWKLDAAIADLNTHDDLEFVVTLGDIIDRHWESFSHILPVYDKSKHKNHFVLGNHDFDFVPEWLPSVVRTVGMPAPYYHFAVKGVRFIVLDGNDVSTFAPPVGDPRREVAAQRLAALREAGAPNAQSWNGSLSDEQMVWLEACLDAAEAADERVIILCHYPVFPANNHNLWNDQEIVALLARYGNVMAYFNGHNHEGNYGENAGQHFVNFKGMVDTPDTTAYAIISVLDDRIEIEGFGREESRTLMFSAAL